MTYTPRYTSATSIYTKTGLSATEIVLTGNGLDIIEDAENELDLLTGRKFGNGIATTEYIDGPKKDVIGITGNNATRFRVSNYPIQSITAFNILSIDGTTSKAYTLLSSAQIAAGTFSTTDYWIETQMDTISTAMIPDGSIVLKTDILPVGRNNIQVSYTYGYATVPSPIRDLATCLAGMRCWIAFLGGSYNRLDSYSIPQQSVSKGSFYQRGEQNIQQLKNEADRLLDRIGRRSRTVFYATGADR